MQNDSVSRDDAEKLLTEEFGEILVKHQLS
jgi:hypothetical protein